MSLTMGSVVAVDETGPAFEAVCEYRCPHRVTPVTRRNLKIIEAKLVRHLWAEGWANTGPQPPSLPAYRALDPDGTEWTRDWEGWPNDGPGDWKTADGRRASTASAGDPAIRYAGQASTAYAFIDLTGVPQA